MGWNFGYRPPPANSDHTILIGLEPFSQQFRRDDSNRATGNRAFRLKLRA
jgi:hypothetical protein